MKSYRKLLSDNSIEENKLSPALKRMVKDYQQIEQFITDGEAKLQSGKLSDTKKQSLETELEEARESLTAMDDELVKKIQYWLDNREVYKQKGERLKQGREAKKNGTGAASSPGSASPAPAATAPATQTPQGGTTPASTTPASTNGTTTVDNNHTPAKKKDNSGWIIGGIFIALVCAVAGVAYHNSQRQAI